MVWSSPGSNVSQILLKWSIYTLTSIVPSDHACEKHATCTVHFDFDLKNIGPYREKHATCAVHFNFDLKNMGKHIF